MQIGDLVKFSLCLRGLEREIGIVIGFNGSFPTIRWANGGTHQDIANVTQHSAPMHRGVLFENDTQDSAEPYQITGFHL